MGEVEPSQATKIQLKVLKSGSHLPKKILFICFIESLLKMLKSAFYFILKALFVLKIVRYLSYFGHVEVTALIRKMG